jgi:hypothetical protein
MLAWVNSGFSVDASVRITLIDREAAGGGHGGDGHDTEGCYDANPSHKPRSHDTSRIAWAKLLARVGEEFPLECPACGGDTRWRSFRMLRPSR